MDIEAIEVIMLSEISQTKKVSSYCMIFLPEKSQGQGTWQATVHGVAKSWTWQQQLSNEHTHIHCRIYIYIYIYIYTIYTHLNIELKALEFVEIEDRMVVSRVWGNWEDVGQRVQTWLKNKIKTQAYQLEKDADSEGDCVYVKYRV